MNVRLSDPARDADVEVNMLTPLGMAGELAKGRYHQHLGARVIPARVRER
jgi:hypothetical protein